MAIKVIDGGQIHEKFDDLLKSFLPFAQRKLGYDKPVDVQLVSDPDNAKDPLGKTAYYDPNLMRITIFVDKRHAKDILRSLSHELVHHKQNCEGQLANIKTEEGYAQSDPHLREMEIEAEDKTNTLLFRDWEDQYKQGDRQMNESILKESVASAIKFVQQEQNEGGVDMPGMSSDVYIKLGDQLRKDDNIPHQEFPQLVDIIVDKVKSVMGTSGMMSEAEKGKYDDGDGKDEKCDYVDCEGEGEKKDEKKSTNENWARAGKDKQLFEELLKRWCK
tara:strand:- start:120 stop:944 length:825 start_codon:yes stop_codon:yes gene_type:complete